MMAMTNEEKARLSEDLVWLLGQFEEFSYLTQSQFSCGVEDDATYARDNARAGEIGDRLHALIQAQ